MSARPPRLARFLLRRSAAAEDREFLLADALEEYERLRRERGTTVARAWYWQQARTSIVPLARARVTRLRRSLRLPDRALAAAAMDARQAWRWLRRNPVTASTAWATLTVAFAASLATWTIVSAVLLRPLPFPGAERIVAIRATGPGAARGVHATSGPDFDDWRERVRSFEVLSAWAPDELRLTGMGEPRQVDALRVARDFDRVLGIDPASGRRFTAEDYLPAPRVAIVTDEFWRHDLGSDPRAIGRILHLNDRPYEIVGILPALDTRYPVSPHVLWIPLMPREGAFWETQRASGWLSAVGRVRVNTTRDAAAAELSTIVQEIARQHPRTHANRTSAELTPIREQITGPIAPALWLLAAALGTVLLIAGGNVINLLLAATAQRRREFAVRTAIGAGRTRLARQVFSETLLICAAAAAVGLALAPLLVRAFLATYPGALPRLVPASLDPAAVWAALGLAVTGGVLLGLPLLLHAREARFGPADATQRVTAGDRTVRTALVAGQVALSFVLIVSAAAFVRTFDHLLHVEDGYEPRGVLAFSVSPPSTNRSAAGALQFYEQVVASVATLPGVQHAAAAVAVPTMTAGWRFGIRPPGAVADVLVGVNLAAPGYFDALGIRLLDGRLLTPEEQRSATAVVVVNAPLARLLGGRVVGSRLSYSGTSWEIVGVVDGVRHTRPREEPMPELFIPWHMAGRRAQTIVVKSSADPLAMLPAVAARVRAIDPFAPLTDAGRLEDRVAAALAPERFRASIVTALAAIALALAALGTYSVTACAVARRTREYGIRLALGERPASIGARALSSAVGPALLGVAAGALLAWMVASWIESFLYGVRGATPAVVVLTGLALVALALAAGSASARRAARVDPLIALRVE